MDKLDIFMGVLVVAVMAIAFYGAFSPPPQEDIDKCLEVTNYTEERCVWELTR